jgi:hypothetical protein
VERVMQKLIGEMILMMFIGGCSMFFGCREAIPEYALYPGSRLIETNSGRGSEIRIISYQYRANASWEDVEEFYEAQIGCITPPLNANRIVCEGTAMPYGHYSVYIDIAANVDTLYTIELSWDRRCTL